MPCLCTSRGPDHDKSTVHRSLRHRFSAIERVIESGLDPRRFVEDLLERLRDLIIVAAIPDGTAAVLRGLPADQLDRMRAQAAAFGVGALSRAADIANAPSPNS